MPYEFKMSKEDMEKYFAELAKELKKIASKNAHFEIVVVGGASIVQNYNFRDMSVDVDALINDRAIKEAANKVADKYNLPTNWINSDFSRTKSYTPALWGFSKYYKSFSHILEIRTIKDEYLIAMKLISGRLYKNDLSDIVGILSESAKNNTPITKEMIDTAMNNLYGGWEKVEKTVKAIFDDILEQYKNNKELYSYVQSNEKTAKNTLQYIENKYKKEIKETDVANILKNNKLNFSNWLKQNKLEEAYNEQIYAKNENHPLKQVYEDYLKGMDDKKPNTPQKQKSTGLGNEGI